MKKAILFGAAVMFVSSLLAQMKPPTYSGGGDDGVKGFNKENIFVGGSLGLGYADQAFSVGGNPEIGYSLAKWLDAGVVVNINYYSQQADPYLVYNQDIRTRQLTYGAGVFARVYPVNFLFVQIQPEQNWVHYNQTYFGNGSITQTGTVQAFSLIAGIGYSRRIVGQFGSFLMVGVDLADNLYSPYRENGVAIPIVRAGIDVYLKSSKRR
jgi:hypothetical protein